jgi:predicted RNase H-like nuclease (RuvC/YqgF family)
MTVNLDQNIDQLRQIYGEMDETGKEKLREVSKQIKNIWNVVNEGKSISVDKLEKFENEGNR